MPKSVLSNENNDKTLQQIIQAPAEIPDNFAKQL
jgi:hypothetical protein